MLTHTHSLYSLIHFIHLTHAKICVMNDSLLRCDEKSKNIYKKKYS